MRTARRLTRSSHSALGRHHPRGDLGRVDEGAEHLVEWLDGHVAHLVKVRARVMGRVGATATAGVRLGFGPGSGSGLGLGHAARVSWRGGACGEGKGQG